MQWVETQVESTKIMGYPSLVFLRVEPSRVVQVLEKLRKYKEVMFVSALTGRYDIICQLNITEPGKIYSFLNEIRGTEGVISTHTFLPFEGFSNNIKYNNQAIAVTLLSASTQPKEVLSALKGMQNVWGAYVIPGEFDIAAILFGKDYPELLEKVQQIAGLRGIRTSETFLAFRSYWA